VMRNGEVILDSPPNEMPRAHVVAIIGLGPKGLYCLERLLAEFHAKKKPFRSKPNDGDYVSTRHLVGRTV
jgi:NADPH-dependent glutamate synthase beta subunit-like oxidoreductase